MTPRARWIDLPPTDAELRAMTHEALLSMLHSYSGTDIENWAISSRQCDNAYETGRLVRQEVLRRMAASK